MIHTPRLVARRLRQTLQLANGPQVLSALAGSRTPWRRDTLEFRTRSGATIHAPNHPGTRVPVYEVFIEDAYRLDELTAGLREDFVALDIGGHIGCFSVALATHSPGATVHAYEASPVTAGWLRRNIDANGLATRVHPHHCALSDHTGTLRFADNGHGSGLNGLTAPAGSTEVEVPCHTFEQAVADAGGTVDLVKIDTEGAEYDIVLGSSPAAWAGVQRVVLEHHTVAGHGVAELLEFFARVGLAPVHAVQGGSAGALWLDRVPAGSPA